jgi:ribonucleoside-diphosphate reductase subunit M2
MFPLFKKSKNKFFLPIDNKYKKIYEIAKKQEGQIWSIGEIPYQNILKDVDDLHNLPPNEQRCVESVIVFFALADEIVLDNISANFTSRILPREAQFFYKMQDMIEMVHSETYATFLESYFPNPIKLNKITTNILDPNGCFPSVYKKHQWMKSKIYHDEIADKVTDKELGRQLVVWGVIEGLLFTSSFSIIGYFVSIDKFPALGQVIIIIIIINYSLYYNQANEFIGRDEALHVDAALELYSHIVDKLDNNEIIDIIREATEIELEFAREAVCFGVTSDVKGIFNIHNMELHVCHIANVMCKRLSVPILYRDVDESPLYFMNSFGGTVKHNQFESVSTSYSRQNNIEEGEFSLSNDY